MSLPSIDSDLLIREAAPGDVAEIAALIRELAIYEKEPDAALATEADLLRDGFGPEPYFRCLMAEWQGQVAGFALYFFQYSTWEGRPALYLEDLFVREPFRKRGIGVALFRKLAQIALDRNCTRFLGLGVDGTRPALYFNNTTGALVLPEGLNRRLSGNALRRLAKG